MSLQDILDTTAEMRRIVTSAQQTGWSGVDVRSQLGSLKNYCDQVDGYARDLAGPEPPPLPPVQQFISPVPIGGVYGATKWLPGSKGCDVFLPRNTPVVAPAACVVEEVIGGVGVAGGDELILSLLDRSWAWRFRHCAALVKVGQHVTQGQQVAVINDASLDTLGAVPAWAGPMPAGWQHADISVDQGTDQFNPQGGGGGNVDACQWLESVGYQGRKLARTPGPPDAGRTLAEAITLMTPAGRR